MKTLGREWPLAVSIATIALFVLFGERWFSGLSDPAWFALILAWLFCAILVSAFAVVRHAEAVAVHLGEPLGTLLLTLAVTGMEVMLITAVMYTGEGHPSLARDNLFAVVMIVLNGMVGLSLLLGGLRHHEQAYNLRGAHAFLAVILPLVVLTLVLPNLTVSSPGPTLSAFHAIFFSVMSIALYSVFLAIQTRRHPDYFVAPAESSKTEQAEIPAHALAQGSVKFHAALLAVHLLPVIVLAKQLAVPIDYGIHVLGAPAPLGGLLVAIVILSPESLASVRAARANQLQRSVNILLGSVLAAISLTIPAVLAIGLITGKTIVLGLEPIDTALLLLTLAVSVLTFVAERTNVLLGAVHLLLFFSYLALIFER